MGKTNFTKVEESLRDGIEKLKINQIVESTDSKLAEKLAQKKIRMERKKTVINMISEIKKLSKNDDNLYKKLGTTLENTKKLLENPTKLSDEEWTEVIKLKNKIENFKKVFGSKDNEVLDAAFMEKEREKQANTRFNIQKRWLPVD